MPTARAVGQDHRRSENVFIITSGGKTWKDIAIVFWHTMDLPLKCLEVVGLNAQIVPDRQKDHYLLGLWVRSWDNTNYKELFDRIYVFYNLLIKVRL